MSARYVLTTMRAPLWICLCAVGCALAGCAGTPSLPAGCTKDVECKGARVCSARQCVEPPPGSAANTGDGGSGAVDAIDEGPPAGPPPFAMFAGDAQNTGRLAGPAPATKPTEKWVVHATDAIVGSPTVGPDGMIFFTSHDKHLYAVTPDGAVKWKLATGDRIWSTPAIAEDGTVYTGSDDDYLYAVNGETGKTKWKFRVGECDNKKFGPESTRCDVDGGPTIGPDGTIYTGGDGVYAVWPDGTLRWKFATPEHVPTAPALGKDGTVFAGCLDNTTYAIAADGTKLWEYRTDGDIESSPAVGPEGEVYFGGDDHAVYAINADGTLRWKVITLGDVRGSPAIARDGTVFVGSYDRYLYAIAPDGAVKWRFAAADKIHGSPAIATDGTVLFGSQDDHLYAISADGKLMWYLGFDGDIDAAPAVSSDGIVYAASDDHSLRAFQ